MYWCFHCYAVNDHPAGPCDACGQPVEAPPGLTRTDGLAWALRHPDGDRAVLAAKALGKLRAREPSRRSARQRRTARTSTCARLPSAACSRSRAPDRSAAGWRRWPAPARSTAGRRPAGTTGSTLRRGSRHHGGRPVTTATAGACGSSTSWRPAARQACRWRARSARTDLAGRYLQDRAGPRTGRVRGASAQVPGHRPAAEGAPSIMKVRLIYASRDLTPRPLD